MLLPPQSRRAVPSLGQGETAGSVGAQAFDTLSHSLLNVSLMKTLSNIKSSFKKNFKWLILK